MNVLKSRPPVQSKQSDIDQRVGRNIRALRRAARMSQAGLGEKLKLHQSAVCRIELGQQMLNAAEIVQISKIFSVSTDMLLTNELAAGKPDSEPSDA